MSDEETITGLWVVHYPPTKPKPYWHVVLRLENGDHISARCDWDAYHRAWVDGGGNCDGAPMVTLTGRYTGSARYGFRASGVVVTQREVTHG